MDEEQEARISQLRNEARAADREDKERGELFEAMVNSPAWRVYIALLDKKIQEKIDKITAPSGSLDGAIALEYEKGAFSGLMIARNLPSLTIGAMKSLNVATEEEDHAE